MAQHTACGVRDWQRGRRSARSVAGQGMVAKYPLPHGQRLAGAPGRPVMSAIATSIPSAEVPLIMPAQAFTPRFKAAWRYIATRAKFHALQLRQRRRVRAAWTSPVILCDDAPCSTSSAAGSLRAR